MKLYYAPGACSLAPHIVSREADLDTDLVKVDLGARKTEAGEDYLAINPKGYVPALRLDDGQVFTEVATLVQYLADRKPESGLAPAFGTLERYRLIEWLTFISSEVHKGFGPLWNPKASDEACDASCLVRQAACRSGFPDWEPLHRGRCVCVHDYELGGHARRRSAALHECTRFHGACCC